MCLFFSSQDEFWVSLACQPESPQLTHSGNRLSLFLSLKAVLLLTSISHSRQLHFGSVWAASGDGKGRVKWGDWVCWCGWLEKSSSQKFSSEYQRRCEHWQGHGGHHSQKTVSPCFVWCHHVPAFPGGFLYRRSCWVQKLFLELYPPPLEWCSNWRMGSGGKASQRYLSLWPGAHIQIELSPKYLWPLLSFFTSLKRKELAIPPFLSVLVSTCCFSFSPHFSCSSYPFNLIFSSVEC